MAFTYTITNVPDFDQRWASLPNKGSMYCVPTSAMNWIHYISKHGWPLAAMFPIANDQDVPMIYVNLTLMAGYMETDPTQGTSGDDAFDGLVDYLDDRWVPAVVITDSAFDSGSISLEDLQAIAIMKGLGMITRGRYTKVINSSVFFRTGGHVMSMVGLVVNGSEADVDVRDPADDSANLQTQSARVTAKAHLKTETRNLQGDSVKILRWGTGTNPYQFIDGWFGIIPSFALTNPTANVIFAHTASFESKAIDTKTFRLPFKGDLIDLTIHPALPQASMIARGSSAVWTLDLARNTWTEMKTSSAPQFLTYGGRDRRLFVAHGKEILSFDRTGKPLDKVDAGVPIDAVSYDQKNNRLIVASLPSKRLLALTPSLKVVDNTEAPDVPGTGRLAMSVNGRDATIVLSREASPEVFTLRWNPSGARPAGRFHLMTQGRTSAVHADRKGKLMAFDDGKIATFDKDGDRVTGSVFDGLPAGPLLKVARSSHNFDPIRSQQKEWKN
jgi:hypothetical protein